MSQVTWPSRGSIHAREGNASPQGRDLQAGQLEDMPVMKGSTVCKQAQDQALHRQLGRSNALQQGLLPSCATCLPDHITQGLLKMQRAPTNGDGMQHGLQVGNVIQQHVEEGVQCMTLPQEHLGGLNMLLLQGMNAMSHLWEMLPAEPSGVKACLAGC